MEHAEKHGYFFIDETMTTSSNLDHVHERMTESEKVLSAETELYVVPGFEIHWVACDKNETEVFCVSTNGKQM